MQDQDLIDSIKTGNLDTYKLLVERYEKLVTHMIGRVVTDPEDIRDVSQEVFIRIYKHLGGFKFQSKLSTWIAKVAYSTAVNYVKKVAGKKALTTSLEGMEWQPEQGVSPETQLNRKDAAAFIQAALQRLPVRYRMVLTFYHLEEFSYQEIGYIMEMPEGTVKNYLFRARKLLKEQLAQYLK